MRRILKKLINLIFKPFGLKVCSLEVLKNMGSETKIKYFELTKEMVGCLREFVFREMLDDEKRAMLLSELQGTTVSEGMYIIDSLHKALDSSGDVCEFGVAGGATSALIANEIKGSDKSLWLFDSFAGLPKPTQKDILANDVLGLGSIDKYEGKMSYPAEEVLGRLKKIGFPISRTNIVPGFIEKTINSNNLPDKVCFAYIDFDFYQPITIALDFLDRHLAVNGIIIVDDFGYFSTGAKTAVEEFLADKRENYQLSLPYKFAGYFCVIRKIR